MSQRSAAAQIKKKRPRKKSQSEAPQRPTDGSSREHLLIVAKRLFARKGLTGTTIRDIASEAKVNSSMISYYFGGKEGLYRECLKEIGEKRLAFMPEILQAPNTEEEYRLRLTMFVKNMRQIFLEDRDTGLVIIREYDRVNSPAEEIFRGTFLQVFDLIIAFFEAAQKKRIISCKHDPFVVASLFFGAAFSQMRLDHMKERTYGRSIKDDKEAEMMAQHLVHLFSCK